MIGALAMAALGFLAILCFSVWLPISTFARNPIVSIVGFFLPPIGIIYGLFNLDLAKRPIVFGALFFVAAIGVFVSRAVLHAFLTAA